MTKRKIEYWVIPPEADAEFVACMEEVLETYAKAYDPQHPVLCMDEQPIQLLRETREPIPATKAHPRRVASITSTSGPARRAFSCFVSLWRDGVESACGSVGRKWIGRWRWRSCCRVVTRKRRR